MPAHITGEARALAESIQASIFCDNPNVRWDDVAGLPDAKRLLREAVVYPMRYPTLFTGAHAACNSLHFACTQVGACCAPAA